MNAGSCNGQASATLENQVFANLFDAR
jgi:hypothetical protein